MSAPATDCPTTRRFPRSMREAWPHEGEPCALGIKLGPVPYRRGWAALWAALCDFFAF